MNKFGHPWKENPGDGAFYGPKIDIKVCDALKREHQLGTVQLDFNLPIRFNLQYRSAENEVEEEKSEKSIKSEKKSEDSKKGKKPKGKAEEAKTEEPKAEEKEFEIPSPDKGIKTEEPVLPPHLEGHDNIPYLKTGFQRPVMIHRAVLGSVERMLAILCEHTGGKWPFWLSPRQIKVIPISEKSIVYAEAVYERLKLENYAVELDRSNFTINKKVRNAQIAQFNFIAVVGEEESKVGCVDLRERDNKDRLVKSFFVLK